MKDLPISDFTPQAKMEETMNAPETINGRRQAAGLQPVPNEEVATPEARAAEIERQVTECGQLFESCRQTIRDLESEYATARTALIDQHRRRLEDMQASANDQLRALDVRYKRQIEKTRQSLVAIARLRGEGNES